MPKTKKVNVLPAKTNSHTRAKPINRSLQHTRGNRTQAKSRPGTTRTSNRKTFGKPRKTQKSGVQVGGDPEIIDSSKIDNNDHSKWPEDIGKPSGSMFKKNSKIYNSNKAAITNYLNMGTADYQKKSQLCQKYRTGHDFVEKLCTKHDIQNIMSFSNPVFANPTASSPLYSQPPPNFRNVIFKLLNNNSVANINNQFVIFIISININQGKHTNICAISKYNNRQRTDYLYYIINKCTDSQRAYLKGSLNDGQFTVYESSEGKFVICTNSKCYMEGEEDELNFKLTKNFHDNNNTTIKYFILPEKVIPKCTKVRNLHTGQVKCDENKIGQYNTIYFNKPEFIKICENYLLFENLYSEPAHSTPAYSAPIQNTGYLNVYNSYSPNAKNAAAGYMTVMTQKVDDAGYMTVAGKQEP